MHAIQHAESDSLPEQSEVGILDQIGRLYGRKAQRINVDPRLNEYEQRLANADEQIIDLVLVYVLQTLVLPVIFLWLRLKVIRLIFNARMFFGHSKSEHDLPYLLAPYDARQLKSNQNTLQDSRYAINTFSSCYSG